MARLTFRVPSNVRLKSIALPIEHGSWSFLYEPILLGLLLAPSSAGFWIGMAALGVFLMHQPIKVALKDWRKGERYPRTPYAEGFAAGYAALAVVSGVLALATTKATFWLPLLLAIPFALLQMGLAARNQGRAALPEIAGTIALGAVAPAIVLANGWTLQAALLLWIIPVLRAITSILYVRARLDLEHGEPTTIMLPLGSHVVAIVILAGLAYFQNLPVLAAVAMVILLVRAAWGLSALRRPTRPQIIGIQEVVFGVLNVILVVIGYRL